MQDLTTAQCKFSLPILKNQAFTPVSNPSSIPGVIMRKNPHLTTECKEQLHNLRSSIHEYMDGERSVKISVYITGRLYDESYHFRFGKGDQHLVITVSDHSIAHVFETNRTFTKLYRTTEKVLYTVGTGGAMAILASTVGPGAALVGLLAVCYMDFRKYLLPIDNE